MTAAAGLYWKEAENLSYRIPGRTRQSIGRIEGSQGREGNRMRKRSISTVRPRARLHSRPLLRPKSINHGKFPWRDGRMEGLLELDCSKFDNLTLLLSKSEIPLRKLG